ncbi:hypothetical protein E5676_scaffold76G00190 [Cucumis melo var. makuwa]|uniref:Zinc finger protein ZPR1-like protein n=1 Tax=Cucumis melo var. makuwa TaxID=1194695 RepID=A0A5A7VDW5_CUCMM|nr:hypothetical protein E6C27_scaffold17G001730 [Cucumis melo var. makuwa]TYK08716.1 hypothetical protein E5676_scaffold76G00190 [Cucumis melo var. makuwa]
MRVEMRNSSPSLPQRVISHSFGDKISKAVLDRRSGYSKGLGWGPKPKAQQTRNHGALVSEVERIRNLIRDMTQAQQGPPHDDP